MLCGYLLLPCSVAVCHLRQRRKYSILFPFLSCKRILEEIHTRPNYVRHGPLNCPKRKPWPCRLAKRKKKKRKTMSLRNANPNRNESDDDKTKRQTTVILGNGSQVVFIPRLISFDQAWTWFDYLNTQIPWTRPTIRVFGRSCLQVSLYSLLSTL